MKKTKLVPITSLDQLEVGSMIVDKNGNREKILAKTGLIIFRSSINQPNKAVELPLTLEMINYFGYQLEVTEEPWVPKEGEAYYCPWVSKGKASTDWNTWDSEREACRDQLRANLICKTREEALAKAQKMLDSIKDSE